MGRYRFGELLVETAYLGPSPMGSPYALYSVKIGDGSGDNWIERRVSAAGPDRTPALEAKIMADLLDELEHISDRPEDWGSFAKKSERLSDQEIEAVQGVAERFKEMLPMAVADAYDHLALFKEYQEGKPGPLGLDLGRKKKLS